MKYKVGDKVRIKSLDSYNENKDNYGAIYAGNGFCFWKNMVRHCGEIMKITSVKVDPEDSNKGYYFMENSDERWTDGMIEGLVEEETKSENELLDEYEELTDRAFKGGYEKCKSDIELNGFQLPEGYIFKDENGNEILTSKIILEKKKKEYPKTYEECFNICFDNKHHIIQVVGLDGLGDNKELFESFIKLKICRDAYWKIAGEEMELGKPWEPDWNIRGYYVIARSYGNVVKTSNYNCDLTFVFPTEEMRDAFYENFKKEIEICKELL